jgi:hypothetical protein
MIVYHVRVGLSGRFATAEAGKCTTFSAFACAKVDITMRRAGVIEPLIYRPFHIHFGCDISHTIMAGCVSCCLYELLKLRDVVGDLLRMKGCSAS